MAKVKVVVDEKGELRIEVEGVQGSSCELLTKNLEKELGEVGERKKKPEYYKKQKQKLKGKQSF